MRGFGEKQSGAGWLFWSVFSLSIVPASIVIAKFLDFSFQDPWYHVPLLVVIALLPSILIALIAQTVFSAMVVVLNGEFKLKELMLLVSILVACFITFLFEGWLQEGSIWIKFTRAIPFAVFLVAMRWHFKSTGKVITSQRR